jgi:hypothetical protein
MTARRVVLAAVLLACVALLIIVVGWEPGGRMPSGPSTGRKVVVVGVDGLDWFLTREMLERGEMPATSTLIKRSLTGEVAADLPPVPQVGWTVLARGRGLTESELGRVAIGGGRLFGLAPELAEQVVRAGGTALSVGWPASWPTGDAEALVVAPYRAEARSHETGLPAAIVGSGAPDCSPELADRVAVSLERSESACDGEFRRLIYDGGPGDGQWNEHLLAAKWAFLSDLVTADVAASLLADEEPDLTMVCFGGLDAVTHRFLAPALPSFFTDPPPEYELYEGIVPNYFRFIDSCIERLRRLTDEHTVFIICSTYGTHPTADVPGVSAAHTSAPPGVMIVRGAEIASRPRALPMSGADLAPTLLATLGLPIPLDMDGRVLTEMVPAMLLSRHPLQYEGTIGPWGRDPEQAELDTADDAVAARLQRLRGEMTN